MDQRRRSDRLPLSIPVRIYGRTPENRPFRVVTTTNEVSVHGGLLPLARDVAHGQTLLVVNGITEEERECRVVYVGKKNVAVEFTRSQGDFWHVYPPLANLRSR